MKLVEMGYLERSEVVLDKLRVLANEGAAQREIGGNRLFRAFSGTVAEILSFGEGAGVRTVKMVEIGYLEHSEAVFDKLRFLARKGCA